MSNSDEHGNLIPSVSRYLAAIDLENTKNYDGFVKEAGVVAPTPAGRGIVRPKDISRQPRRTHSPGYRWASAVFFLEQVI